MVELTFSKSISVSGSNKRYKYFNVSPRKKLSMLSFGDLVISLTSGNVPYPYFVLQCFSILSKISHPHCLFLDSLLADDCIDSIFVT
jgi:hypothetical protein